MPTSNVSHSVQIMAADGNARAKYAGQPFNACKDLACQQRQHLSTL